MDIGVRQKGWIGIGLVLGMLGVACPSGAAAQDAEGRVKAYVERMAGATPTSTVQRRLEQYEPLIEYFTGLSFTRPGVTVNAAFVRALIAAESGGVRTAVSDKGAIGLMQILPSTAHRAARDLYETGYDFRYVDETRLRDLKAEDLEDPAINVLIGCYLIDRYNGQYGNDLSKTVSAWNAGPRAVDRHDGAPPYVETLELIGRVNAYYLYYERRGGG